MLFNSLSFIIFLPIVFTLYWLLNNKDRKFQNILLLISSYYFYACWDPRFLFLLIFSTALDYYTGLKISRNDDLKIKKLWFLISVIVNLGILGVFKYYNFFAASFADFLSYFGLKVSIVTLNVILPIGISFYTFHGLSYVIDIYKDRIKAEKNLIDYSVFVCFFPLLVAGPIERATHLLPQIQKRRYFQSDQAINGLKQILWGFFKKLVIADQCAIYTDEIFNNYENYSGSTLVLGAIFFAFQIYGDFSGYSDIALGVARLFGIELLKNFSFPYFSRDIAEFWRRWHISLTTWFRDYLYIPLGGSKGGSFLKIRNTFIIFLVSGFWHGANWTFIFWGLLNALYFIPLLLSNKNRSNLDVVAKGRVFPDLKEIIAMLSTFGLTTLAWIFFRSPSLKSAIEYISIILSKSLFHLPVFEGVMNAITTIILIIFFLIIEWLGREDNYALEKLGNNFSRQGRIFFYMIISVAIFLFMQTKETPFIYFQF